MIDIPMSVLLLYCGETSFFVAKMRAIIVKVFPYKSEGETLKYDGIKQDTVVPSPCYHHTERPSRAQGEPPEVSWLQLKRDKITNDSSE
jgi:hypothetical protein